MYMKWELNFGIMRHKAPPVMSQWQETQKANQQIYTRGSYRISGLGEETMEYIIDAEGAHPQYGGSWAMSPQEISKINVLRLILRHSGGTSINDRTWKNRCTLLKFLGETSFGWDILGLPSPYEPLSTQMGWSMYFALKLCMSFSWPKAIDLLPKGAIETQVNMPLEMI